MSGSQVARRALVASGLLAVALVHVLDLPGKWEETPWMGYAFAALIAACVVLTEVTLRVANRLIWPVVAIVALGPVAGFVLTRTVGLPGARDDIGNWLEPLGLASLFVEVATAVLALGGLLPATDGAAPSAPPVPPASPATSRPAAEAFDSAPAVVAVPAQRRRGRHAGPAEPGARSGERSRERSAARS
jgi:hypothetical protein